MTDRALAGQRVFISLETAAWQAALTAAVQAAGAELVARPAFSDYAVTGGAGAPALLAEPAAALQAVVLVGSASPDSPSAAAIPAWARYWALQLAPQVRVNALLLDDMASAPSGAEAGAVLIFLLAEAGFTTGASLCLDGGRSL